MRKKKKIKPKHRSPVPPPGHAHEVRTKYNRSKMKQEDRKSFGWW